MLPISGSARRDVPMTVQDEGAERRSLRDCHASRISEIPAEAHRANVMRKMKADSLADLEHGGEAAPRARIYRLSPSTTLTWPRFVMAKACSNSVSQ